MVGIDLQDGLVVPHGFLRLSAFGQHAGQAKAGSDQVRLAANRPLESGGCLVRPPLQDENVAEICEGLGVVRVETDGLLITPAGFVGRALAA